MPLHRRLLRVSARACRRLDRPHSRLRRTGRRNLRRLVLWPLGAVTVAVALIGFTQPDALNGQPVDAGPRTVVVQ